MFRWMILAVIVIIKSIGQTKNAANYILFSSNEQSYAMMLSQNVLAGMLMPNLTGKDQVLNQFFYQQQNNLNQTDYQLEDILK